jgi:hypothetical protein
VLLGAEIATEELNGFGETDNSRLCGFIIVSEISSVQISVKVGETSVTIGVTSAINGDGLVIVGEMGVTVGDMSAISGTQEVPMQLLPSAASFTNNKSFVPAPKLLVHPATAYPLSEV